MKQQEYLNLYEKYLKGEATEKEINMLLNYVDDFALIEPKQYELHSRDYNNARRKVLKQLRKKIRQQKIVKIRRLWGTVAAASIIIFIVIIFWQPQHRTIQQKNEIAQQHSQNTNSTLVKFDNGKVIALDDVPDGTIFQQGNISIEKQQNGILKYLYTEISHTTKIDTSTIITPHGTTYKVILPDGSTIWLNAATSLRFPIAFNSYERKVYLSGEAYFEVAKNKGKPFIVKFKNEEVEVLGTHFNIMAYSDEQTAKTTLVEGSVRIVRNSNSKILLPGQQAETDNLTDNITIREPIIQNEISWKEGYYIFRDASIETIMKQVQRWHDIEVVYQGDLSKEHFGGRISKYENINELLKNLETTGTIHFKTAGKKIIVMKKK